MGQPVIITLVLRQAVEVHLGQEAKLIGQTKVPKAERHRQTKGSPWSWAAQGQVAVIDASRQAVRNVHLDVEVLALDCG